MGNLSGSNFKTLVVKYYNQSGDESLLNLSNSLSNIPTISEPNSPQAAELPTGLRTFKSTTTPAATESGLINLNERRIRRRKRRNATANSRSIE